ncbi:MAG TPA: hypothetical protein VEH09_04440 [Thermodesulfobacteriota bacterium]|nr:hypothetical protein [Thermodesulfobacteriota bacterium]
MSGGPTGVDRATLDVALDLEISSGKNLGWSWFAAGGHF